jgi:Secretion system C-terminal sorting domain
MRSEGINILKQHNFKYVQRKSAENNCAFLFDQLKNATIYYRVKGKSITGEVKYTETRVIKATEKSAISFKLFPNPTKSSVSVNYTAEKNESIIIRIKNLSGQQLTMKNSTANTGINAFQLDEVKNFVPGIYYIDIISGNQLIAAERFIKQ